ncbi:hypothetical protein [Sporosarcina globispora]|uniref:hypothetical protein n=1 Tax=Sporosarcina globispora TaxID=1459 RepID=UPI000A58CF22|nr:hypothetical protein [Sporosarcina globispora]
MCKDGQNKNQKQNKVQGVYRKIKQQNREDKKNNEIGVFGVVIILLWLLIIVLNAIFDL